MLSVWSYTRERAAPVRVDPVAGESPRGYLCRTAHDHGYSSPDALAQIAGLWVSGTEVCAIAPEEPASILLTGIFNTSLPKQGERNTPGDAAALSENPKRYYTPEFQKLTRAKLQRITCPIFIVQGDMHRINHFNAEVLIPELRAAGKSWRC